MTVSEKELTLKATAAEAPRLDTQAEAPSRYTFATAESLGFKMEPEVEVPEWARAEMKRVEKRFVARMEEYLAKQEAQRDGDTAELGEVTEGPYVGLDVIAFSPFQTISRPPWSPSKIIAAGELAVITALVVINDQSDPGNGFTIPANVQLSNRTLRVRLEQVNLSDLTNGPDFQFVGVLSAPAPVFTVVSFPFVPADPGPNPDLIEANVTVDIDNPALPWAAMATRLVDLDEDPGILGIIPPEPANRLLTDIPNRYLVYRR